MINSNLVVAVYLLSFMIKSKLHPKMLEFRAVDLRTLARMLSSLLLLRNKILSQGFLKQASTRRRSNDFICERMNVKHY